MPSTKLIIVLVGIPAAGKTKLARELSLTLLPGMSLPEQVEGSFVDLDFQLSKQTKPQEHKEQSISSLTKSCRLQ